MNKREYLQIVTKQIRFRFDRNAIETELNQHLNDSMEDLMAEGFCKEDAERIAVEQMGDPVETGKALNQEHHPVIGYLWLISKIALTILAIPAAWFAFLGIWSGVEILFPVHYDETAVVCPLDIEHEVSTLYLKLDDIVRNERGDYFISYRARLKYNYSRALNLSSYIFEIEDSTGESNGSAGRSSIGAFGTAKGAQSFIWPEDNLIYIVDRDGDRIEINLEEYWNEPEQETN